MAAQEDIFVEKNKIDFKLLASKMLRNWYWFAISLFICLSISWLYLRYATPIYRTDGRIYITSDKSTTSGEDQLTKALGGQTGAASSVEAEAEILKTRHLMIKVAKDLKSYITYYHKGQIRTVDLYKSSPFILKIFAAPDSILPINLVVKIEGNQVTLSNEQYTKKVSFFQPFILPGIGKVQIEKGPVSPRKDGVYGVKVSPLGATVAGMMGKLDITIPIKQVDIIGLGFTNPIAQYGEDVLNKLIEEYIRGNIEDKNQIADSTIAFIDNRLVFVSEELSHIEGNVQTFKQENKIADVTAQSGALVTTTNDYSERLAKVETSLTVLNSIENFLVASGKNQRIVPSGALIEDPSFSALVDRYNMIVLEKERSALSQTEDNPRMQNLNTQIAGAKEDMLSSLRSLRKSLNISKSQLQSRSGSLAGEVKKVPVVERKFLDLTRQQDIKQTLYTFLLQKREETAISKTSNTSSCKVIEPPLSFGPVSPVRANIQAYAFILGLFIPFGITFLREILNSTVASKEQVASLTQVSIIGEIGKNINADDVIAVSKGSRTPISEQFRSLRTNLGFFLAENEKTVLLTSSMSGEGKSFISLNLATALAISGKKVVVIEMDLRKPNLSNKLGIRNDVGFSNYIVTKDITIDDIIKPSGTNEELFIINSGTIPPNPSEIILNKRTDELMLALTERFDYIIVDAPPIGMVTDAQLLSKYADLTLYVVRQGFTFKDQIEIPQEIYHNRKMKNIAIIMNDVESHKAYGYGYGYGYGVEETKKSLWSKIFKK